MNWLDIHIVQIKLSAIKSIVNKLPCPKGLNAKGNFWKFLLLMLQTCSMPASIKIICMKHIWDFNLITVSAIFVFNKWYDTYRDTYRVSYQCIDDTYRIVSLIRYTRLDIMLVISCLCPMHSNFSWILTIFMNGIFPRGIFFRGRACPNHELCASALCHVFHIIIASVEHHRLTTPREKDRDSVLILSESPDPI